MSSPNVLGSLLALLPPLNYEESHKGERRSKPYDIRIPNTTQLPKKGRRKAPCAQYRVKRQPECGDKDDPL